MAEQTFNTDLWFCSQLLRVFPKIRELLALGPDVRVIPVAVDEIALAMARRSSSRSDDARRHFALPRKLAGRNLYGFPLARPVHCYQSMDQASISPIALVEAAYDLEAGPTEWLPNLLRAGATTLDLGQGCAAAIWAGTSDNGEPLVSQVHAENGPPELAMRFACAVREIDPDAVRATPAPRESGAHTLAEARCSHPGFHEALTKYVGCKDMLTLCAMDPDLHGVGIHLPSTTVIELSRQARKRWHTFAVHIASGHRLRRSLGQTPRGIPVTQLPLDGEALLDPKRFSVVEAADHAKNNGSLDEIRRTAIQVDLARGRLRKGESREALQLWEGVLRGRWSMVDWFDTDGRRYILALPNAPHIRDPRGLTEREYQVATHAGTGDSCKLIAYRLGVSRSRVSDLLGRAMRKLGVQNRGQLVIKMRTLLVESASSM